MAVGASDLALSHPWLSEHDRWKELVFALLTRISVLPEAQIRSATDYLSALNLLDVAALANAAASHVTVDKDVHLHRRMLEILQEAGFSQKEARRSVATIGEAALTLQKRYDGKVQRYLRRFGELILDDAGSAFRFSNLNKADVKRAFTYWLQNVLNMPLSLSDQSWEGFSRKHRVTPQQLVTAADELDVTLSYLDDLIHRHMDLAAASPERDAISTRRAGRGQSGARRKQ